MSIEGKRDKEKQTIRFMVSLYEKNHKEDCRELLEYALLRIDKCPFMSEKTFCSSCKVHCYQKQYREQMKKVMRYSGPRMLLYHPILAITHVIDTLKNKPK